MVKNTNLRAFVKLKYIAEINDFHCEKSMAGLTTCEPTPAAAARVIQIYNSNVSLFLSNSTLASAVLLITVIIIRMVTRHLSYRKLS